MCCRAGGGGSGCCSRACSRGGGSTARVFNAFFLPGKCSGVLLVLNLALDDLSLGATAGSLNPLDVLVKGGQDGLQLRLEGVRLQFGTYTRSCFEGLVH